MLKCWICETTRCFPVSSFCPPLLLLSFYHNLLAIKTHTRDSHFYLYKYFTSNFKSIALHLSKMPTEKFDMKTYAKQLMSIYPQLFALKVS